MSRRPGPEKHDPFSPLLPPRTPGSLGSRDAGDPHARAHPGDTPGSLGVNDGAALDAGCGGPAMLRMVQQMAMGTTGAGTAFARPPKRDIPQSLREADTWFVDEVMGKRTTWTGLSWNRAWKSPRDWVTGNNPDPQGLCGDTAEFVFDQYYRDFLDYATKDGFHIALILWEGKILNHIADVMLLTAKQAVQKYEWDPGKKDIVLVSGKGQYTGAELLPLRVYDLYYKQQTTVKDWWKSRDSDLAGTIKLGFPYNIDQK